MPRYFSASKSVIGDGFLSGRGQVFGIFWNRFWNFWMSEGSSVRDSFREWVVRVRIVRVRSLKVVFILLFIFSGFWGIYKGFFLCCKF